MKWLNRKEKIKPIVVQPPAQSRVEIELHKNATEEAAEKAKKTNQHLSELILDNGFTLKVFIAAGGAVQHRKVKK